MFAVTNIKIAISYNTGISVTTCYTKKMHQAFAKTNDVVKVVRFINFCPKGLKRAKTSASH